ncbi:MULTISPECIES: glycine cleavage system aminomethyltransferase GcvT [unclassified Jeotgalibaca]|uniref:glycine cleavage system aminomethyltransferase GcvT n=1 Tax=unclassified Jeotgalibaca TaxID=2621505 RepID=UPI003FD0F7B8
MGELKQTPLFGFYQEQKIKLVDFGGWAMPIQFSGIMKEHQAVRESVGIFDCSHMGEILVTGPNAESYLNSLVSNNVSRMTDDSVQYNVFCTENGGAVDDVMIYRFNSEKFWVVCNASNTNKVWKWMLDHKNTEDTELDNISQHIGLIAIQGPKAEESLQKLTDFDLATIGRHKFNQQVTVSDVNNIMISRTGYTGEDGFELYIPAEDTEAVWRALLEIGTTPCGLGSRDTLRLEAGLPLYGQDLSENISPIMAGVGFAVKTKKQMPFLGQEALKRQREEGTTHKIVGFEMLERGIPRHDYKVLSETGEEIGIVTSGTQSPTLQKGIGMALVKTEHSQIGTHIQIAVRNKNVPAQVVEKPFYKKA